MPPRPANLLPMQLIVLGFCSFAPFVAQAQVRPPAWLEVSHGEASATFVDINNVNRNDNTAATFSLIFVTEFPKFDGEDVYYMIIREVHDCLQNTSQLISAAYYDADSRSLGFDRYDSSEPEPVIPGTVGAARYNVACFPNAEGITASQEQVRLELAELRGLSLDGSPAFEVGTIVALGGDFAAATATGYQVVQPPYDFPALAIVPRNLTTVDPDSGQLIRFDGSHWVDAVSDQRLTVLPRFDARTFGMIFDTDKAFVYLRGWRPLIARPSIAFENGTTRWVGEEISTYWNGRLWFGFIYSSTESAVADRLEHYPPRRQSPSRRQR